MKHIILIGILLILISCCSKEESYSSADESMKVEFNETIHEVKKCSISVMGGDEYLAFAFFGECKNIENSCKKEDICDWYVSTGASCYKEKCSPSFTGRCVCRFEGDD